MKTAAIVLGVALTFVPCSGADSPPPDGAGQREASGGKEAVVKVQARAAFEGVAVRMCVDLVARMSAKEKQEALKGLGVKEDDLPAQLARMFLEVQRPAFELSEKEAQAVVEGRFEDAGNQAVLKSSIRALSQMGAALPLTITYWIEKDRAGKIAPGLDREFAARLLAYQVHLARQATNQPPAQRPNQEAPGAR